MNYQILIDREYRSQTETNLRFSLNEIDVIRKYEAGDSNIIKEHTDLFNDTVNHILEEFLSHNHINEEYIKDKFGVECYEEQRLICSLLYFEAGKRMSQKKDLNLDILGKIYDHMDRSFFYGFELSVDRVESFINELQGNHEHQVLLKSSSYHLSGEQIAKEYRELYKEGITEQDRINTINLYNEGSYIELPLAVNTLAFVCQLYDYRDQWNHLFEVLSYYPLQGCMLYRLQTTDDYLEFLRWYDGRDDERVILSLIPDKLLKKMTEVPEHLTRNSRNQQISQEQRNYSACLLQHWQDQTAQNIEKITRILAEKLGVESVSKWLCKENVRINNMNPNFAEYSRNAISLIDLALRKIIADKECIIEDTDIATLIYYARNAEIHKAEYINRIVNSICCHAYSDRYTVPIDLTENGFETMRLLYSRMKEVSVDGADLMLKYRKPVEGFKVDYRDKLKTIYGDNFWLPILMLQCETLDNQEVVRKRINYLFNYAEFELSTQSFDYFVPFYIAEIIVTQIMPDLKEAYELRLIEEISSLVFVLRVLSGNEGVISDNVKSVLRCRVDHEWELEKQLYRGQDKTLISFLERYIIDSL